MMMGQFLRLLVALNSSSIWAQVSACLTFMISEEPGVLAGFSTQENLPDLRGGILHDTAVPYAYVPLARRIDIDRVYRVLRESRFFSLSCSMGRQGLPG